MTRVRQLLSLAGRGDRGVDMIGAALLVSGVWLAAESGSPKRMGICPFDDRWDLRGGGVLSSRLRFESIEVGVYASLNLLDGLGVVGVVSRDLFKELCSVGCEIL